MKPIRTHYAESSVDEYYETYGNVYENPHYPYIAILLQQNQHRIDYSNILDFCAGGGEVTTIIKELGYNRNRPLYLPTLPKTNRNTLPPIFISRHHKRHSHKPI
jgi:hypothetical protein